LVTGPENGVHTKLELREAFHERLAALSGNEQLLRMLREIDAQIYACRRLDSAVPERAQAAQAEHLEILNLLEQGKIGDARRAMRNHIEKSQSTVRTLMRAGVTTLSFGSVTESSRV
jgi:DNA-binding GntR family transcriptional regulator